MLILNPVTVNKLIRLLLVESFHKSLSIVFIYLMTVMTYKVITLTLPHLIFYTYLA